MNLYDELAKLVFGVEIPTDDMRLDVKNRVYGALYGKEDYDILEALDKVAQ